MSFGQYLLKLATKKFVVAFVATIGKETSD